MDNISKIQTDIYLYALIRSDNDVYLAEKICEEVARQLHEKHMEYLLEHWCRLNCLKKEGNVIKGAMKILKGLFGSCESNLRFGNIQYL